MIRPLRVGLTGGIASGKSTVARHFAALGAPVIDADAVGRELLQPGTLLLQTVAERFGPPARARYGRPLCGADGQLDRALLRRLIFEDAAERAALEALMHPAIRARIEELAAIPDDPYQIHVNPLLAERGARGRYDRVLVVDCPEALQRARLARRDASSSAQIDALLAAQATRTERLSIADDIIVNDAAPEALAPQVAVLDANYRALARLRAGDTQAQ